VAAGAEAERQYEAPAPYSVPEEIARRTGYGIGAPEYHLEREKFRLITPDAWTTSSPAHGLLVWISPGNDAWIPADWPSVLASNKLLFIGPKNSGNDRHPIDRIRLALDAACNATRNLPVDRQRIYVGGFSGGGRITSILGVAYGDLFTGTICICGVNFYKEVPASAGGVYPATFFPEPNALASAKQNGRFVLITGETDINRDNTQQTATKGFKAAGFKHVDYIEVRSMGHAIPSGAVLNTALQMLTMRTNQASGWPTAPLIAAPPQSKRTD
jgi:predicted peptidase